MSATQSEARVLGGLLAIVAGTGLAGSLFPAAETAITATVAALAVLALAARITWWRIREYRADRADARAAAAARAAYAAHHRRAVERLPVGRGVA
jgi:predicted lipid-binding transport protein (Tim44 family)